MSNTTEFMRESFRDRYIREHRCISCMNQDASGGVLDHAADVHTRRRREYSPGSSGRSHSEDGGSGCGVEIIMTELQKLEAEYQRLLYILTLINSQAVEMARRRYSLAQKITLMKALGE